MFGGVWKKRASGEIPRGADQQFKLAPEELLALERRTHPCTCEQDHIDPVIYTALEIRAQVNRGERPAPEQVVGIFWAKGDGVFWTRQTRTWDLPSLTGVYAHRFTFKYIYSAWTTFPLIVKTQRRGRNVKGSTSDKWMGNIIQMRKEAVPFLESLGIPKPHSKEEWSYIFKEMGTFLAAKNFIVNCPLPVMEMPVAPVHDSKGAAVQGNLRRADYPPTGLAEGLQLGLHQVGGWPEQVFDGGGEGQLALQRGPRLGRAGPAGGGGGLVRQVGLLPGPHPAAGLLPPLAPGGAAKEADPKAKVLGADTTLRTPGQATRRYPTAATVTAVAGQKYVNKHFLKETKRVFWASVECGLVLPSISAWEVVSKEKFKTTGGYMCRFCKGFWKASRGGTRLIQITGWHRDKATCLQLVMDEPPEQLYNQWIRDRMEFYKRVEPTEPPRNERLVLGDASTPRMRFSSSNGLGDVSTALWSVILSNPEKSGLAAIHSVAKEAILKGVGAARFRLTTLSDVGVM